MAKVFVQDVQSKVFLEDYLGAKYNFRTTEAAQAQIDCLRQSHTAHSATNMNRVRYQIIEE